MRVVLYAEGSGDLGSEGMPPAPGRAIETLGPAHVLLAKSITAARGVPESAIRFEQPLRMRSRVARGSDLITRRALRRLLTWADASMRPDLAVVLVDADGSTTRRHELEEYVRDLPGTTVIAVAVQEFESWLIADADALEAVLSNGARLDGRPEDLPPREAKALLAAWCSGPDELRSPAVIRLSLANHLEPARLQARSASYKKLLDALSQN